MPRAPLTHEHLVVEVRDSSSGAGEFRKDLQKELDKHAREGWRVVSIAVNTGPENGHKPSRVDRIVSGGGGNRTRVHERTRKASTSVFRD
jgi:Domain of unknown function (DUF4177)